jgi:hypothetical protein
VRHVALPEGAIPLLISRRRVWLGGLALACFGLVLIPGGPLCNYVDFPQFWAAGRTVGTPELFDPARRMAWQAAHGLGGGQWVYPPGSAWLFWPFGLGPMVLGFSLHAAVMVGLVAVAGVLGARIYGLDRRVGLLAAFAWTPCLASAIVGQNAALGLAFSLLAIEGLRRDDNALAGLGAGLLLYKPTLALPLLGLLLLRRRWAALLVAAACAGGWYLAGVGATAGDWRWPAQWVASLRDYYELDTDFNVVRAISIPGLLQGLGVPSAVAWAVALGLLGLAVPRLLRAPIVEAGAGACLVGLAVSPHALNYEGALILPALLWALGGSGTGISEPARTRLIVAAYIIQPEFLISDSVGLSILAPIVLVGSVIWILGLWISRSGSATAPAGLSAQLPRRPSPSPAP